jgi:ATP-dependent Clp protease ATP-binding subunit ClpB
MEDRSQPVSTTIAEVPTRETLDPNLHGDLTRDFETYLLKNIVGQDAAVKAVSEIYQMFLVGLSAPDRPIGNLLFLGPTGSGKTHVVEIVAEALFKNRHAFTKIDCAEFQESHEISKLIGSPPGYVGHGQTQAMMSQEAIDQWQTEKLKLSLVLFDEIEKASLALWQLLLGILDKASLTLGDNRHVSLSNCIIFMTSNLGATEMSEMIEGGMGFVAHETEVNANLDAKITRTAMDAARKKFSPEFINRIDRTVVFKTLRPEHLHRILDLELARIQQRIATAAAAEHHFTFHCTPQLKDWLLKEGTDSRYGARHLKRVLERNLVYPLANLVATDQVLTGEHIEIDLRPDGTLSFIKTIAVKVQTAAAE